MKDLIQFDNIKNKNNANKLKDERINIAIQDAINNLNLIRDLYVKDSYKIIDSFIENKLYDEFIKSICENITNNKYSFSIENDIIIESKVTVFELTSDISYSDDINDFVFRCLIYYTLSKIQEEVIFNELNDIAKKFGCRFHFCEVKKLEDSKKIFLDYQLILEKGDLYNKVTELLSL